MTYAVFKKSSQGDRWAKEKGGYATLAAAERAAAAMHAAMLADMEAKGTDHQPYMFGADEEA
jgi:hypothetical protein